MTRYESTFMERRLGGLRMSTLLILVAALGAIAATAMYLHTRESRTVAAASVVYTCPMHPQIQATKPGDCPICGMKLVPRTVNTVSATSTATDASVMLSDRSLVRANVTTEPVEFRNFLTELSAVGVITIPETGQRTITAKSRGRIERLYKSTTGTYVSAGEALYDYYSPDILNAEQEYLIARKSNIGSHEHDAAHVASNSGLIAAARARLRLLGLTEAQVTALESSAQVSNIVTVTAPASGVVMEKLTQEGAYVDEGTALLQLADLSTVWAEIDVPEASIRFIRAGQIVYIRTEAYPNERFAGKVMFISPIEDQASRSIRVRATLANTGYKLRPQMTFTATFEINQGHALGVPASAVVRTGTADYVWVQDSTKAFSSRKVMLGALAPDNYYQIESGVLRGEQVAASGAFFLDAEHQLTQSNSGATMSMSPGEQSVKNK